MILKRPKAILFDHDGVLVSSELLHFRAWQKLLKEMGLPWEKINFQGLVGRTAPYIISMLLDQFKPGWSKDEYDVDALALQKNDYYLVMAQSELEPYDGVREGLEWAKNQGIACAVVSNAKRRELTASMSKLKLEPYFKVIVSRDDALRPKPDPAPFELAAISLGVDIGDCIAIDDSPVGLESALRAGAVTASVKTNYSERELKVPIPGRPELGPVFIAQDMRSFFDWVKSLPV